MGRKRNHWKPEWKDPNQSKASMVEINEDLETLKEAVKFDRKARQRNKRLPKPLKDMKPIDGSMRAGMRIDLREAVDMETKGVRKRKRKASEPAAKAAKVDIGDGWNFNQSSSEESEEEEEKEVPRPPKVEVVKKPTATPQDITELLKAAALGQADEMKTLMKSRPGLSVHVVEQKTGLRPLHLAAGKGHLPCVKLIIGRRADPAAMDKVRGWDALKYAAHGGHQNCVELLAETCGIKAIKSKAKSNGKTALQVAIEGLGSTTRKIQLMEFLIEAKSSLKHKDALGRTLIHSATGFGKELLKVLEDAAPKEAEES
mmetsp:Transcript_21548/g.52460  ORF Transcript_21548/g.52460 Transcript_21548/m.52460 type:complete len:315 (+) Transcript_21548:84-1028(+)